MPGIELNLTPTFQKSLSKLNKQEQNVVSQAVMSFWMDPSAPGLRFHSLNFREPRFHSISPNMDLRVIVLRDGARHVMMYVDHHDRAYSWAEGRKMEQHPVTGSAQIVEFEEVVREEIIYVKREIAAPPLFAQEDDEYLLSLGVPQAYLLAVKQVDEVGLFDLCARLPEEAQEALLELAAGGRPIRVTPAQTAMLADPFTHPDARRRFWVAPDEEALAAALEKPWAEWLVFLHPSQRAAVERVFDGPARVSGSAGTGKSIVSMHRAAHLARSASDDELVLLTSFSKILASRLANGVDQILGKDTAPRRRLVVSNLHAYAHSLLIDSGRKFEILQREQLLELLMSHRGGLDRDKFSDAFIEAEWNAVIDYWGLESWEDYEKASRTGRGSGLPVQHRRQLWQTFSQVRAELSHSNLLSWGDLCDEARRLLETGDTKPFRHVIVDESQDLGPRE